MQCQRLARFVAVTAYHIQHAVRQARLFRQPGQPQGGEGRFFGRFQYHAIARDQRRAQLPAGQQQREVPGDDGRDNPDRFAHDHRQLARPRRRHFAVDFIRRFGVPANGARRAGNIVAQAVADGFTGVQRFQ